MVSLGEDEVIVLECPLGITEKPLVLVRAVAPVITSFNGALSQAALLNKFAPMGLTQTHLEELIDLLDSHLFLENDHFLLASNQLRLDFSASRVREPALSGICYDSNPVTLKNYIQKTVIETSPLVAIETTPLLGLVSPHIDYQRGSLGYGETYQVLKDHPNTTAILIGTSHKYSPHLFHLTIKDFNTPLGPLTCDVEFTEKLISRYGPPRALADEFLHKKEHSLELQTPFMKALAPSIKIVPILVGGFHEFLSKQVTPSSQDEYESFVGALTETCREHLQRGAAITVIAGVDMAHVGPQFGDRELTPAMMEEVHHRDQEYLQTLLMLDKEKLFSHIAEDNDKRRICGFPTMYTVLDLYARLGLKPTAKLLGYHQAVDYKNGCAVTFGSIEYRDQT